jgi:hypothetical protein
MLTMEKFNALRKIEEDTGQAFICPECTFAFVENARFLNQGLNCCICDAPINDTLIIPVLQCEGIPDNEEFTTLHDGEDIRKVKDAWPHRKNIRWVQVQREMIAKAKKKSQADYEKRILKPFQC